MSETTQITEPGIYRELDESTYHGDPVPETSLSHSGAKRLLESPARFRYEQECPPETTKALDHGSAAHAKVLGVGSEVVAIPDELLASNGAISTKDAKAFVAEAKAAGQIPLKRADVETIDAMAAKLLEHDAARALFAAGEPEISLFGRDAETSLMVRARLDWRTRLRSGRPVIVDYKTSISADPKRFGKIAHERRYFMQDPWYCDLADDLFDEGRHGFLFVVQEKTPPYLVSVCELDDEARALGRQLNAQARRIYVECMTTGYWPGYPAGVNLVTLPSYALRDLDATDLDDMEREAS